MRGNNFNELRQTASRFRSAIEACDKKRLPITLQEFPRGACGDAALLLGKYLQNTGFGLFDYVCGNRRQQGHAWLQRQDLIIDITADQFREIAEPVLITTDNRWHKQFKVHIRNLGDFEIYDRHTVSVLSSAYKNIVSYIAAL